MIDQNLSEYYKALKPTNYQPESFEKIIEVFLDSFESFLNFKERQIEDFSKVERTISESTLTEDEKIFLRTIAYDGRKRVDTLGLYFAGTFLSYDRNQAALNGLMEKGLLPEKPGTRKLQADTICDPIYYER